MAHVPCREAPSPLARACSFKLTPGRLPTPAGQIDLHPLTSTVNQHPDDVALISLVHNLMLRPCGDEGKITR